MEIKELRKPEQVILKSGVILYEALKLHSKWLKVERGGKRLSLKGEDLSTADLSTADLRCADLRCADLSTADLSYADLSTADLSYADLSYADLSTADLSYADLSTADLSYADLYNTNLCKAKLNNTNFIGSKFFSTNLYKAEGCFVGVENVGSRNDTTHYFYNDNRVICGCFDGSMEEFEDKVKKKYNKDNHYYKQYMITIDALKKLAELEKEKNN